MREFQYELMRGAVYLNAHLSKRKLINTNSYTFCSSQHIYNINLHSTLH